VLKNGDSILDANDINNYFGSAEMSNHTF